MKYFKKFFLVLFFLLILTGCKPGKQMKYEGKYFNLIFNVKYSTDYRLSQEKNDFRTAREEAVLISDNFKIGVETSKDLSNEEYNGDFNRFKSKYKDSVDFKEVKYGNLKGFRIYCEPYARYELYFPVDNKYILRFNVYAFTNNKKSTTKVLKSSDVKQIFKYLDIEMK